MNNSTAQKVTAFYDDPAKSRVRQNYYHQELERVLRSVVMPGQKVLDLGCGSGDLLAALQPAEGVGIDLSTRLVELAERRHGSARLRFLAGDAEDQNLLAALGTKFDVVLLSNCITELHDVQAVLTAIQAVCHPRTRLVILSFSRVWQLPLQAAERLGWKNTSPVNNWLSPDTVRELLALTDYEVVRRFNFMLAPVNLGWFSRWFNRLAGNLPGLNHLDVMFAIIARPNKAPAPGEKRPSCSLVIPCRNEAGHIAELARQLPDLGADSEVLWVEGNSTDDTAPQIQAAIARQPGRNWRLLRQPGRGKGDAVRYAFTQARGDILLILDADITVSPQEIPKFIDLFARNKAEFVNGSRLVYPMDEAAMRFLNLLANHFFARLLSFLIGQPIRDTLCGTKGLWRSDYEKIAANRAYFGDFDPYGDFDLLFGAARLNLKIVDLPVRYGRRTYGTTNISRFQGGWLLLKMSAFAARKLKFI